jgi:hypothetical protein
VAAIAGDAAEDAAELGVDACGGEVLAAVGGAEQGFVGVVPEIEKLAVHAVGNGREADAGRAAVRE